MSDAKMKSGIIKIQHNNADLSTEMQSKILEINIEDEINLPAMFSIHFNLKDVSGGQWFGIDLETFIPGDVISISMGTETPEVMIVGEVTDIAPVFSEKSVLVIRGFDRLHRLRFGKFRRSFQDMTDSDIFSQVVSDLSLTAEAENTEIKYPYVFQNNTSNYEFLLHRIKRIGFELKADDKKIILCKSGEGNSPEVSLEYGTTLEEFSACLRTLTQGSTVEVRGWNPADKKEITGSASGGDENSTMETKSTGQDLSTAAFGDSAIGVIDEQVLDDVNAVQIAKGIYNNIQKLFLTGEGKTIGNPKIRAGETIELKRIGTRFSGIYYIYKSLHCYSIEEGYKTSFAVQRVGI